MSNDFLSLFNESNSIKKEETNEIIITSPLIEVEGQYKITTSCSITSNCHTLIKCELIEIISESVSFSSLKIEGNVITVNSDNFMFKNCTITSTKKCADSIIVINSSKNVQISNTKIYGTPDNNTDMSGLMIKDNSEVNVDETEICNLSGTLLPLCDGCTLVLTNSHLHDTKANGIHTNGENLLAIVNCVISDTAYPLIFFNESRATLENNVFKNSGQNGISIENSPYIKIKNNIFESIRSSSISVASQSLAYIKKNSFSKIEGNSIYTKFSEVEIINNQINDQKFPAFAITNNSTAIIKNNKVSNIILNGIALRNAKLVKISDNEIDTVGECGISISNTEEAVIENNKIKNCKITAIESYNHSKAYVKNNSISKMGENAFLCYTSGYMKAENNSIEDIKDSMTKLAFKGYGEFIDNKIKNCPSQVNCLTSSLYFFNMNGEFEGETNNEEKVADKIKLNETKLKNSNVLCLKCNKNPRNCYLFECCHKVYCQKCADLACKNKENCPLCRFPIEKVSEGYGMNIENLCILCCENEPDSIILPCGHAGVCSSCLDNWFKENEVCPCCRCESKNYRQIDNDI